jgi:UDP-2,3-diacylglucosamine pyrophosphatase LpxH
MRTPEKAAKTRLRSVFLSDVHLGSKDCRAQELLDFLSGIETDYLFLVGDIVDFWSLRRTFHWPQEHNDVLRTVLAMAKEGTRVIYVPGNHDEDIREFCGSQFGNLSIRRKYVHATADGREFLVMHGDEFDTAVKCSRWLARFGAVAYEFVMRINRGVNVCRRMLGMPFWSLATYVKLRLGNAVRYVQAFETAAAQAARSRNLNGIICGHTSIVPASGTSMACSIATMATGSRAARPWSNPRAGSCFSGSMARCSKAKRSGS